MLAAINTNLKIKSIKDPFSFINVGFSMFAPYKHSNWTCSETDDWPTILVWTPLSYFLRTMYALHQPSSNLPNHIQGLPIYARERFNLPTLHSFPTPSILCTSFWLYNSPAGRFKEEEAGLLQAVHSWTSRCHDDGKSMNAEREREVMETVSLLLGGIGKDKWRRNFRSKTSKSRVKFHQASCC